MIAYRIDQTYPETQYGSTNMPGSGSGAVTAKYSTSFVLVWLNDSGHPDRALSFAQP
ncbi:hypothetical protein PSEUDO8AS_10325 [Pseudomonas sp. 8AS]|nr:hypothetical protein PSEUDO8AS_10325 [Pseudomonas sp. 8AS]